MDPRRVVQRSACPPTAQHVGPDKNSHRPAVPGNRDFLTVVDAGQQLRKLSPCLGNGDRCHDRNCTSLYIEVQQRGAVSAALFGVGALVRFCCCRPGAGWRSCGTRRWRRYRGEISEGMLCSCAELGWDSSATDRVALLDASAGLRVGEYLD